jgi:hypothetical protein
LWISAGCVVGTVNEIMVGHRASEILVYHLRVCEQNRPYRSLAAFASKKKDFLSKYAQSNHLKPTGGFICRRCLLMRLLGVSTHL